MSEMDEVIDWVKDEISRVTKDYEGITKNEGKLNEQKSKGKIKDADYDKKMKQLADQRKALDEKMVNLKEQLERYTKQQ
jgi:hypothetical protein